MYDSSRKSLLVETLGLRSPSFDTEEKTELARPIIFVSSVL